MDWLTDLHPDDIARRLKQALIAARKDIYRELPPMSQFSTDEPKPAAVLIPLLNRDGDWHLLFTRRHADLPEHSGQVAFPGGRADPEDSSPTITALREAKEEIGLEPKDVIILGQLKEFLTITNYLVTPVVALIPWPYEFSPADNEVSRIFTIPLRWLAAPENYEEHTRNLPSSNVSISVIYFHEYDGEILWGASARFTLMLLEILRNYFLHE
jgi:8-oxo-dGTP pyrophosphatase MutT (NUDIX family)